MSRLSALIERLVPTLMMAVSVTLLTAGVLSYAPSAFGDWQTPEPLIGGGDPLFTDSPPSAATAEPASPSPVLPTPDGLPTPAEPLATDDPTPSALPSFTPGASDAGSGGPTPSPTEPQTPTPAPDATPRPTDEPTRRPSAAPPVGRGYASRIRIPSLDVDLPVVPSDLSVPGNRDYYPLCDVAMYMVDFVQPGESGSTYIYGHAQRGMFLPLLRASLRDDGASMLGALVEVYTSDDKLHLYEIFVIKRHATDLSLTNVPARVHQLVLQTSEGYAGHVPKLQLAARPISVVPASQAAANPRPRPRVCLPPAS